MKIDENELEKEFQQDIEKSFRGEIPWNPEDFKKVAEWFHVLVNKPKDDWDLSEKGIILENEGKISKLRFNKMLPENQLAFFMLDAFGPKVFRTQFIRCHKIAQFIKKNRDRLEKDRLTIKGKDVDALSSELLEALCVLPFSKIDKRRKHQSHEFNYREVVQKAKEIAIENGKQ